MNEKGNLFEGLGQSGGGGFFGEGLFDLGSTPTVDPFAGMNTTPPAGTETSGAPKPVETPAPVTESEPTQKGKIATFPTQKLGEQTSKATQAETPQTNDESADNPLLSGMAEAEEKEQHKQVQGLSGTLPVFSYNGCEEEITNPEMTFEELREAKSDDFLELEEAGKVTWDVNYGGIHKIVSKPRKTKIIDFKREIEVSKEFMSALKKSKDKTPKCIVKPSIRMEKKGIAAYRGIFPNMTEAKGSDKAICVIPSRDGKVYELRRNDMGEFLTPTERIKDLDEIKAGFTPALPPIPYVLFERIVSLFRYMMFRKEDGGPKEALAQIFWDKQEEGYFINVPRQKVSKDRVFAHMDNDALFDDERYIHYADVHSHNTMEAKFSAVDDMDEQATRVYVVVGRLDKYYPELSVRICNGGVFLPIRPETVLESRPKAAVPEAWFENITVLKHSHSRCSTPEYDAA